MKIVQLAPWFVPLPPPKYGGIELVVDTLTEELVKMGHEVYLLAPGDSKTSAHLVPCTDKSYLSIYPKKLLSLKPWTDMFHAKYMASAVDNIRKINPDIVHDHIGWMFLAFRDLVDSPIVTTEHWSTNIETQRAADIFFKGCNFVSISDHQKGLLNDVNWVGTVYNGINLANFEYKEEKDDYFIFLGRTSKTKGLKEVCEVIKQTKHKLKIAAYIEPKELKYYHEEVLPLIDGEQIEYVGEVGLKDKVELLKNARALLSWLNWDEPFGLVTIEANACGTPVIVNKRGAMEEIIVNGKNGYLVDSTEEMIQRIEEIDKINPQDCRNVVEEKFSSRKMAEGYLEVYKKIISQS